MTERTANSGSRTAASGSVTTGTALGPTTSGDMEFPGPISMGIRAQRATFSFGVTTNTHDGHENRARTVAT